MAAVLAWRLDGIVRVVVRIVGRGVPKGIVTVIVVSQSAVTVTVRRSDATAFFGASRRVGAAVMDADRTSNSLLVPLYLEAASDVAVARIVSGRIVGVSLTSDASAFAMRSDSEVGEPSLSGGRVLSPRSL